MSIADPVSSFASSLSTSTAANAASLAAQGRDHLDQKSFLQLMIAQFKNQDPSKPQDPSTFLGQLAQFSTVSGIQDMQTSISTLSDSLRSSNVLGGATLVGRTVLAPHDAMQLNAGDTIGGGIDAPTGVSSIQVSVKDAAGQLVRRFDVPAQEGLNEFSWDGVTDRGEVAAPGKYSFTAQAKVSGSNESLSMLLSTRVDSVTIDPTTHNLMLNTRGMGVVPLTDVRRVM